MLEKDMENLIAQHPLEFFPDKNLKLVGQQVKLASYFADIIFEADGYNTVIEVKRGILKREAIAQIIDYYGVIKEKDPHKNIILIIVANVIPKERTIFLSEKLGIKFLELPITKIKTIATKYSYQFLDAEKPEQLTRFAETTKQLDNYIRFGESKVWIFQANPERYDILNAMADESLNEDVWLVNQNKDYIRKGDVMLIWMSGKEGGIYAVTDIMSNPEYMYDSPESTKYWLSEEDQSKKKLRVRYKYKLKLINNPILKEELKNIPELKNLAIFRQPQGTNFPVSTKEWHVISSLIKKRFQ